jgi:hypothetical protein
VTSLERGAKSLVSGRRGADANGVEAAHITWRPLGRLLVEQGLLTDDELERALAQQQATGKRLGETIVGLRFVSGPDLASALATQYGIELTMETGFGTGLRAQIQRRHENDRGLLPQPVLSVVEVPQAEPEDVAPRVDGDQPDADGAAEALLLVQLEEQWARLAAAEAALIESEREIRALRSERDASERQRLEILNGAKTEARRNRLLEQSCQQATAVTARVPNGAEQLLATVESGEPASSDSVQPLVEPASVILAVAAPPEPVEAAVLTLPFHVEPQEWNLSELDDLVRAARGVDPVRGEELGYLLHYLREFASPDRVLPISFDALVRQSFGEPEQDPRTRTGPTR